MGETWEMGKTWEMGEMGTMQPVIRVYAPILFCLSNKILNNPQDAGKVMFIKWS